MFSLDPKTPEPAPASDWKSRLRQGLARTGERLKKVSSLFKSHPRIDEALYEHLEDRLLASDVGVHAAHYLIDSLRRAVRDKRLEDASQLEAELRGALVALLRPLERAPLTEWPRPFIILLAGVNGAGKTTTIGKLTRLFQAQGKSVLLAAGDTFRAAAREQLAAWGKRHGVSVVSQEGGDSAAVIYDAIQSARAKGIDVVLADTAGRLPTQLNLMDEIRKVKRVIAKAEPAAPHETWLVLDANTGQNAVQQVKAFDAALGLTGLIVTKLDGTAKGGAVAAIAREHPVAIRFIGIGEKPDDLRPFVAADYVNALFE